MEFPSQCPHCGKDIADFVPDDTHYFPKDEKHGVAASNYICMHCKNSIYILRGYIVKGATKQKETVKDCILSYYPQSASFKYRESVKNLSPNAYKVFFATVCANSEPTLPLVGAGLRMSLEWLVYDYLIKVKGFTEHSLEKATLAQMIEKMNAGTYVDVCAKIIKTFGNDSIHVLRKYDITIDEAFSIYDTLCALIDAELIVLDVKKRISLN